MIAKRATTGFPRRGLVMAAAAGAALAACPVARASEEDDDVALIQRFTGKTPAKSDRVHLSMPKTFPNGYTVPLLLQIESPMTEADHVRYVRVLAPKNPLIEVATYHFAPLYSLAHVQTRVRLAGPQFVLAVAEMNDGALLMAKTWVDVATDGCK